MIESWTQQLAELGPIYPFVGAEWLLLVVCGAFWLMWMIWQLRSERSEHARAVQFLREGRGPREPDDRAERVRILDRRLAKSEQEEKL